MNMTMSANDFRGAVWLLLFLLFVWGAYNSDHADNKFLQVTTSFWLGLMVFMTLFYIIFSKNI